MAEGEGEMTCQELVELVTETAALRSPEGERVRST